MTLLLPKDAAEVIVLRFDYAADIEPGETISGAAVTCAAALGTDGNAAAMLDGAAAIAAQDVQQRVAAGITGNTYRLRCAATLSSGRVLVLAGLLPIREA
jgi:hypothetical protein